MKPWTQCRIVAFDTETTGFNAHSTDRVIEFGAVELMMNEDFTVAGVVEHQHLINPGMSIPRDASEVSGIKDADVAGKPKFAEVAQDIWDLLEGSILIAHNFNFDFGFLRSEFRRIGKDWPKTLGEVDTLQMARRFMGDLRSKTLTSVATNLSIPLLNAHRAVDDAEATGRVFAKMASSFASPLLERQGRERAPSGRAPTDLIEMIQWAQGTYPVPDNVFIARKKSGVPEFIEGPFVGELVEFHQDYLQWMTIAKQRVNGQWMYRFPAPLREWIFNWLINKSAGGNPVSPRSFAASDWQSVEPVTGIYAQQIQQINSGETL